MNPQIAIIVCTRNRAESLRDTLTSISRCNLAEGCAAEILVVDNGSTDHTREAAMHASVNIPIRYIYEGKNGKSFAFNRGLAETDSEIILCTDDDLRVPTDWVKGMSQPIISEEYDAVTGEISIAPHLCLPFITSSHRINLMEIPNLSKQHRIQPFMIGANMGFSRRVLELVPGFNTDLGAGKLGFMEDTLFYLQLLEAGYKIGFVSGLAVEHHFDADRVTRVSQMKMARGRGLSLAYVSHHWSHAQLSWLRTRMLLNLLRVGIRRLRWMVSPKEGWDVQESIYYERWWHYKEFGRLAKEPRVYDKKGLKLKPSAVA